MAADQYLVELRASKRRTKLALHGRINGKWERPYAGGRWTALRLRALTAPRVHVGRYSWLKAEMTGDAAHYMPGPVDALFAFMGRGSRRVTPEFIVEIERILRLPNVAGTAYRKINVEEVLAWLRARQGRFVTVTTD